MKIPHLPIKSRTNFSKEKVARLLKLLVKTQYFPPMKLTIQNALLTSFLNGFCRITACWKGLELRSSNTLQHISNGKTLQVRHYKIQNMYQKML
jgi:hypothetical protein